MILLLFSFAVAQHHIIVKWDANVKSGTKSEILKETGSKILREHSFGFERISIPAGKTPKEFSREMNKIPEVDTAFPDPIMHTFWKPNDTYYNHQWNFRKTNFIFVEQGWDITQGGDTSVIIGILDTGGSYEEYAVPSGETTTVVGDTYHLYDDYRNTRFVPGYDFVNSDSHPNDNNGHGTNIQGIIGESTNNSYGCAGIAFNTKIMPVKVMDYKGSGYSSDAADGIKFAADNGAKVINMSFGYNGLPDIQIENALDYAYKQKDVVLVAAAGNDNDSVVYYPAKSDSVIAVGAVDSLKNRASYSNYGTNLEVMAPGGDSPSGGWVLSEDFQPYGYPNAGDKANIDSVGIWGYAGTSQATPHVAALAGLIRSVNPALTAPEVRDIIKNTATDLGTAGWDKETGYGLINFQAALTAAGINEKREQHNISPLKIFPNPNRGIFEVNYEGIVRVYNVVGRLVISQYVKGATPIRLNVPAGIYFITFPKHRGSAKLMIIK